jgi:adenosylmethionine---8-amino-7-oxononanoate aminotransferase
MTDEHRMCELRSRDLQHLWHPYTDATALAGQKFPIVERADGVRLFTTDGKCLFDGISSWWACNLGHRHPRIVAAVQVQMDVLDFSILGGMSHPNAIRLAERLAEFTPGALTRVFLASDGASATEAALKISLQHWRNVGQPQRTEFASLTDGYHGDTLGAVGVGFVPAFHAGFEPVLHKSHRADSPHCFHCPCGLTRDTCDTDCFASMERIFDEQGDRLAAVIVEPLCQGAAGMRIYPEEYLKKLRRLCDSHGVLLIADEIAVGFGRTGALFACDRAGIVPDILCLGKGLTSGCLPLSATVTTDKIFDTFSGPERTFYHGHTHCGNPIAAAAALAALDVYAEMDIAECTRPGAASIAQAIDAMSGRPDVVHTAALGMIGVVELDTAEHARAAAERAVRAGLLLRPLGNVLYLWPPLVTEPGDLATMLAVMSDSI